MFIKACEARNNNNRAMKDEYAHRTSNDKVNLLNKNIPSTRPQSSNGDPQDCSWKNSPKASASGDVRCHFLLCVPAHPLSPGNWLTWVRRSRFISRCSCFRAAASSPAVCFGRRLSKVNVSPRKQTERPI